MAFTIALPRVPGIQDRATLDIIDGNSTAVQRSLRRDGAAGYEPSTMAALLSLFEIQKPGFTFFDVGANVGLYAAVCATIFEPAAVVGFEPTPETARIARKIVRVNELDVVIEECALGAEAGSAELFLSAKSDASNSLVEGFKENVGTVTIDVETLDGYVARTKRVPDIVKIDTETFEPQVLTGATETLRTHHPLLVVEVLHRKGHDHGEDLMKVVEGLGYRYHDINPYSEWSPESKISGDPSGGERDWLLTRDPLPDDFLHRFERWQAALSECTADLNGLSVKDRTADAVKQSDSLSRIARPIVNRARRVLARKPG